MHACNPHLNVVGSARGDVVYILVAGAVEMKGKRIHAGARLRNKWAHLGVPNLETDPLIGIEQRYRPGQTEKLLIWYSG